MGKFRIFFIIAILLAGVVFLLPVHSHQGVPARVGNSLSQAEPVGQKNRVTRILVLGCDRAASLTDSILVLSVESPSGAVRVLQIPRDTYAAYTEQDYKKLNGAYTALGLDGVKKLLSGALGVSIDYAVVLNLDCVSELVNAVGGVDVEVPQRMQYSDPSQGLFIDLEPGMQHLNGTQAEHFLRFRSGYANADLGRMDAQKRFLQAYFAKCQSVGATGLLQILWAILPHMQTDLPIQDAIRLVHLLPQSELTDIPMETAPGEAVQGSSGAWYYSLNRAGMIRVVNEYLLPGTPVTDETFDPDRLFDRADLPEFHRIYTGQEP